jgi:hypothetical protein
MRKIELEIPDSEVSCVFDDEPCEYLREHHGGNRWSCAIFHPLESTPGRSYGPDEPPHRWFECKRAEVEG